MFERDAAACGGTTETREVPDVLSDRAIDHQNRWSAERNAQRRELISRDLGSGGSTRWGSRAGKRSKR